ncbi:MAG: SDR family oxidoreductase [Flavobacteriales bacterium]|jgi:UDP-glucose 4-epimerase|nr:SDR family oxidoreductase [Flavobacteriales bacterium]NCG30517.1 NAD-dependent epimerase/dehydratase family protein [Bacteroidota bacterium]MBT3963342.1 SDR family oxidoreductase [Flavobacteriales bacterium]MBT4705549.1 SDR family oxidoreductase [Flavobacteriales bacterium]MBT4931088.1 SDR family oxidoreductase [Flavobacteriales bacterium]
MKVLITGGAGYIGTALCAELMSNDQVEEIVVYDNLSRHNYNLFMGFQKLDHRFKFIEGDILDSRNLRRAIAKADVVFHLAAKVTTPFADQDAHLFEQVNHWGTAEVCYAVEESDAAKLVYVSSVSVYGSGENEKTLESELNPRTFYGISKMRGEEHVRRLAEKKEVFVVRCGNVYGYNKSMRFDAVINKLLFEANFNGKINIHGNGNQHRPFVFIETVQSVLGAMLGSEIDPGTYNLVGQNYEINEIALALKELYPDLETIFINHNMKLRELKVDLVNGNLGPQFHKGKSLLERLTEFKGRFTF